MFSFMRRKQKTPAFMLDFPQIAVSPDTRAFLDALKATALPYKLVTDGYITFEGRAFGCDVPLMFGIHFDAQKISFIEVFRPRAYYLSESYDINESFTQLSGILRNRYGKPVATIAASIDGYPCDQWVTPDYIVNHYIMDRFGPEEHLHINFYKK